jgi:probable phosphoglycerate mutase
MAQAFLALAAALAALGPVPPGSVRLLLVRHGQAFTNLDQPPAGVTDPDHLTELGKAQIARTAAALKERGVSLLVTSPAGRAQDSAKIFEAALGKAPRVDRRLRPLDLGRGPKGELSFDERSREWHAGRDPAPPGGESVAQMGARVDELARALLAERPGQSVVCVGHGELIAAFVGHVRRVPPWQRMPPRAPHGSVTVVDVSAAGATVRLESQVDGP